MENKLLGLLGLCRKAGKLTMGFDVTKDAMEAKTALLVLLTPDLSERTAREMERLAEENHCRLRKLPVPMDEIREKLGKRCGVFGICESGFARRIEELSADSETDL